MEQVIHIQVSLFLSVNWKKFYLVIQCSCFVAKQLMTTWTIACQAPLSMGFLQARILEWVAIPFSRGSSRPRNWTHISYIAVRFFTVWATREAQRICWGICSYQITPLILYLRGTTSGGSTQWEGGNLEPNTTLGWMAGSQLHLDVPWTTLTDPMESKTCIHYLDSPELDPRNPQDHINTIWMGESKTKNGLPRWLSA